MKKILLLLALVIPSVQAEVYDIKDLDLKNYQGQVVYLDFWASWCKPCQKSFPWMNKLQARYPAESFKVITINLDQQAEDMHEFLKKVPADFDVFSDPSGQIAEKFELQGMPTSYLINKQGKVAKKHIGFYEKKTADYEKEIEELL